MNAIIFLNEQKQILCCPGPNIEEKLSGNETTPASNGRYMIFCSEVHGITRGCSIIKVLNAYY